MTIHHKTEAFVFKKEDNLEADRAFSVFTKDFGRTEVFGKSIRKIDSKLRGGIEIFSFSEIEFIQGRNKKTLTDAVFIKKLKNLFEDEVRVAVSHNISQLAESFIKGEESDGKIWDLLVNSFERLDSLQLKVTHVQLIYDYFFWNFISILGHKPELSNCANCQKKLNPYELYFSNKEGGIICKSCHALNRDAFKIKSDTVKIIRLILQNPPVGGWDTLSRLRLDNKVQEPLRKVSDSYYSYLKSNYSSTRIQV